MELVPETAAGASPTQVAAPRPAGPDWEAVREEIHCPLCDYNLRGLTEPRCPECGYPFIWADLLEPSRRGHPYLFEHHPKRNFWSFWKTACGGNKPWEFWKSLSPSHVIRPGRMVAYWVLAMGIALVGALGPYATTWVQLERQRAAIVSRPIRFSGPASRTRIWTTFGWGPPPVTPERVWRVTGPAYLLTWAFGVSWPWLTFLALMIFRWSMRRAKVRAIQVRRCVLYSSDVLLWTGLLLLVLCGLQLLISPSEPSRGVLATPVPLVFAATFVFMVTRLAFAYAVYLRFHRPVATIIASQLIVLLIWGNVLAPFAF